MKQAAQTSTWVRWLVVYIEEAHASDEWPVGSLTSITRQPQSIQERCSLAGLVQRELLGATTGPNRVEVVVDSMQNCFQRELASWPIRMYVLDPHTLELRFKAQPDLSEGGVHGYQLDVLSAWLARNVAGIPER